MGFTEEANRFINEAVKIAEAAENKGLTLRVFGAVGFRIHCPKDIDLFKAFKREFTDIDFFSFSEKSKDVRNFILSLGYKEEAHLSNLLVDVARSIFYKDNMKVEVFYDRLDFCHQLNLRDRLRVDFPTISVSDLMFEKMQIVQLNEKDIKDTIVLFLEHKVGNDDKETINANYISKVLANDWGFYYTVTTNLKKIKDFVRTYKPLSSSQKADIEQKIDALLSYIEKEPKSLKWKMRAKIGTKKKWYREVEEIER